MYNRNNEYVFTVDQSTDFSGNSFMETYTLSGLHVDIQDFAGAAVVKDNGTSLISDVKLVFTYKGSSDKYGGYTSSALTNATEGATVTVNLTADSTGKHFVQTSDATFLYAGEYTTTLSFKVGEGDQKKEITYVHGSLNNMPVITVSTERPTVKVTGITPTATSTNRHYNSTTPTSVEQLVTGSFFTKDDFNAVVYLYFKYATDYGDYDQEAFDALIPKVQLRLSGMPDEFTSATATFGSVEYKFTPGELQLSKEIGSATDGEYSYTIFANHTYPKLYPAGTHYVDSITVVYNSVEYTLNLTDRVTISQPDAPVYLDYSVFGYGFSGNEPDMEISHDGGAITVTLPTVDNWVSRQTEYSYGDATPNITESTVSYLTSSKKGIIFTTYYYDLYTRTKTSITAATTTTVFDGTYAVTGWKIGNTVYAPGDTVTISTGQTAVAVIEEVTSARVVISSTTATQTTVTLKDVYSSNTSQQRTRSDATTTLYTADKYPDGYTYVE